MLSSWATRLTTERAIRFETLAATGSPNSRRRRPAATRRHSGCIRPAAPAAQGLRPPAARHGRVRRRLRARRARHRERDRCFSVAKLFFAYGLGNGMYFPFAVGATSILWPGPVTPPVVYDDHRTPPADVVLLGADALRDAAGPSAARRATSICRASGTPCRPARRFHPPCSTGSGIDSASKSSTASARPRSCTSSSRTSRARASGLERSPGARL